MGLAEALTRALEAWSSGGGASRSPQQPPTRTVRLSPEPTRPTSLVDLAGKLLAEVKAKAMNDEVLAQKLKSVLQSWMRTKRQTGAQPDNPGNTGTAGAGPGIALGGLPKTNPNRARNTNLSMITMVEMGSLRAKPSGMWGTHRPMATVVATPSRA